MPRQTGPGLVARYGKALAAGTANSITYLIGVMTAESDFGDLSTAQWLGTALAFLVGSGIVVAVPKGDELVRLAADGTLRAGPAARLETGDMVGPYTATGALVKDQEG